MGQLTFREEDHSYWLDDGTRVPNVTGIIAAGGLTDYSHIPPDVLARAQEEGKAVHKLVELDCRGELVLPVPGWMRGHYEAWLRFLEESGFEPALSEHRGHNKRLGYAGTLDLFGEATKLKKAGGTLIDIKRSFYAGAAIGIQLAAYADILKQDKAYPPVKHRAALKLQADGKYRLEYFEDTADMGVFLSLLTLSRWKASHGHAR